LLAISDYQTEEYGSFIDTSAADTLSRIIEGYFAFDGYTAYLQDSTLEEVIAEMAAGRLVLLPVNGRKLGNPNFVPPGPLKHMILLIGFDKDSGEFITNDPGTRKGASYRYSRQVIASAWEDYSTSGSTSEVSGQNAVVIGK
jgi:hypothetical protein